MNTLLDWNPALLLGIVALMGLWVGSLVQRPFRTLLVTSVAVALFMTVIPQGSSLRETLSTQATATAGTRCLGASLADTDYWLGRVMPREIPACQQRTRPPQ